MAQFNDEGHTAINIKGKTPQKVGDHFLVIGKQRLKYLTTIARDKDYERHNPKV